MLKRIDWYIIRKFLGTFLLSIVLVLCIVIIIDLTDKMDRFYDKHVPLESIIFDYYLNFIPFFFNMLSPLFVFIAVIFFTSKLAGNSEIIAMQASGVSYNRLLRPYLLSALVIALAIFFLGGYTIPNSNKRRLIFEDQYLRSYKIDNVNKVQMEVEKGVILYIDFFQANGNMGSGFSMEKFEGKKLVSRLTAQRIAWDSIHNKWKASDYIIRQFSGIHEKLISGAQIDTVINVQPQDFFVSARESPQMNNTELSSYLKRQKERGVGGNIKAFENEYYKRFSMPFAAFILTLMGVSLSSKKVRGGTGVNIGLGLLLSALYVLFSTFTTSFSINGTMSPVMAVWLPNIIFTVIAIFFYFKAPK